MNFSVKMAQYVKIHGLLSYQHFDVFVSFSPISIMLSTFLCTKGYISMQQNICLSKFVSQIECFFYIEFVKLNVAHYVNFTLESTM